MMMILRSKPNCARFLKGEECFQAPLEFSKPITACNAPRAPELFVSLINTIFSYYPPRWNYAFSSRNENSSMRLAEVTFSSQL